MQYSDMITLGVMEFLKCVLFDERSASPCPELMDRIMIWA